MKSSTNYVSNGVFTLDDSKTDNETYEMSKLMASVILSQYSVNTFIQFYPSHFNPAICLDILSWSCSVWTHHKENMKKNVTEEIKTKL